MEKINGGKRFIAKGVTRKTYKVTKGKIFYRGQALWVSEFDKQFRHLNHPILQRVWLNGRS